MKTNISMQANEATTEYTGEKTLVTSTTRTTTRTRTSTGVLPSLETDTKGEGLTSCQGISLLPILDRG